MRGDPDAAVSAINPPSSDRADFHRLMVTMTDGFAGFFKGKKPRLERTLPDVKAMNYPVALQIWSFGDSEVHFAGCLIVERQGKVDIYVQLDPSVDDVVSEIEAKLKK